MSNCPEYLERNALIERIEKAYCDGCENYNGVRCRACGIGDAIDVVEDAPTALERTAEWIVQDDTFTRVRVQQMPHKKSSYTLELLSELWFFDGEQVMSNTLWHPASEPLRERTQPLLLATKTTWRDKDGKMLQGISPTAYFLGCYADGQFWDEIGERLPKDVTVTH